MRANLLRAGITLSVGLFLFLGAGAHQIVLAAPEDGVLRIAMAGEPATLDPHRYNLRLEETLLNDLFTGLTTFDAHGAIVPGVAQAWQTSPDGLTWTFDIRPGQRWSDGHPLTADDFVYSMRRLQAPETAASLAYFLGMLKNARAINRGELPAHALGAHAPDPQTLVLELEQPYPWLLERLLYPTAFPVPRHIIELHGEDWVKPAHFVGNGAYVLADWVPQSHVALRANRHFSPQLSPQPAIDTVRYVPVVNEQSAYNRYRAGELHAIGSFPVGELDALRQTAGTELRVADLLSMFYLVFNTRQAPFDDVRVRQALSLLIDQSVLTQRVMRNGSRAATSFAPALLQNYAPVALAHVSQSLESRVALAQALLEEAGYTRQSPLRLTLRHVAGSENKKVNLAISGMWRQAGVQTRLTQADVRTHFAALRQGDFEVAWAGWVGENNPEHYLSLLQTSSGSVNYGAFSNPVYDALMQRAQAEADLTARLELLRSAEAVAAHYYPVVPLYTSAVRRLVKPQLLGWHENLRDMHPARHLRWSSDAATSGRK